MSGMGAVKIVTLHDFHARRLNHKGLSALFVLINVPGTSSYTCETAKQMGKSGKIEPNSKQVPIRIISQNLFCDRYKNCSLKGNHDVITTFSILPDAAWHGLQHKDIHQRSVCKSYLEAV